MDLNERYATTAISVVSVWLMERYVELGGKRMRCSTIRVSDIFKYKMFKYFFKYIVSSNISFSQSYILPAKLVTFTATSPNSANYITADIPPWPLQ